MELLRPSSVRRARRRCLLARRTRGRAAAAGGAARGGAACRRARRRAARRAGRHDRRRDDARGARGRARDPGGAARGVPTRGLAAASQRELARRQPPPVDAVLVLAARLSVPPARRGPLPRPRRRASRARDLRERLLRVRASLGRGRLARRARRAACERAAASSRSRSCTGSRTRATGARRRSRTASCCSSSSCRPWRRASTSRRWTASAGRSHRWESPRRGLVTARLRIALAGVAPIPWRIESVDDLDAATPLPRTEWKVPLARALVRRALAALG